MRFEFEKNMQGFSPQQQVHLNIMKHQGEHQLICKCTESCDIPGIIRTVNLPQLTTYTLNVTGSANNSRTYLHVQDLQSHHLYQDRVYLKKTKQTITLEFTPRTSQIRIGVLMGGDSIVTSSDYFMISEISLTYSSQKEFLPGSSDLRITRSFETVRDLEREITDPCRGNGSPMEIGEYAILKCQQSSKSSIQKPSQNPSQSPQQSPQKPIQDNLYVLSRKGLQYVCGIGEGIPGFFGEALQHNHPGKVMPVYDQPKEAQLDLQACPDKFYEPKGDYLWSSMRQDLKDDIYLYLDSQGYVRWLRQNSEPNLSTSTNPPTESLIDLDL